MALVLMKAFKWTSFSIHILRDVFFFANVIKLWEAFSINISHFIFQYRQYKIKTSSGNFLNFRLCDTRGFEEEFSMDMQEMSFILDGNIPDRYQVHVLSTFISLHQKKQQEALMILFLCMLCLNFAFVVQSHGSCIIGYSWDNEKHRSWSQNPLCRIRHRC